MDLAKAAASFQSATDAIKDPHRRDDANRVLGSLLTFFERELAQDVARNKEAEKQAAAEALERRKSEPKDARPRRVPGTFVRGR